ncbi:hypothetical protein BY996DRAFT_8407610 [Phakopsora pachyrhizi]|nr:hypothetical protein BY996DRAFT_6420860 [Phakopsora pachyrhizi]KAI8458444.1 hypothetical protein BY996DRAFT_8407610 [Phakopsora pachyrhizi]
MTSLIDLSLQIYIKSSALPAKALVLESYKSNNPVLLRRRSPTIIAAQPPRLNGPTGPEIVEPFYIDKTAVIDPSAKIGPNVSIGANVRIRFGARVRDSIILDNTILEQNSCVLFSILGEDNKIGAWARVEGAPIPLDGTVEKNNISVLGKINISLSVVYYSDPLIANNIDTCATLFLLYVVVSQRC